MLPVRKFIGHDFLPHGPELCSSAIDIIAGDAEDPEAETSRTMLFDWGIGINDADNGVAATDLRSSLQALPPHSLGISSCARPWYLGEYSKGVKNIGKEAGPTTTEEIFAAPIPGGAEMRAVINQSVASSGSANPIAAGNQAILTSKKREILYENGYTIPGKAVALLAAEAVSGIEHSAKLGGNIEKDERRKDANWKRPTQTDAHHVVAAEAIAADIPRKFMFAVGIGINDRDNGVLLPRYQTTKIATMPNASPHQHIHTALYYSNVVTEFYRVRDKKDEQQIRTLLKSIARRLQNGQFGY